jgi:short-subunit dehydrogenase
LNVNISNFIKSTEFVSELYLCAGIGHKGFFINTLSSSHLDIYKVNLLSRIEIIRYFINLMVRYKFGKIIIVSSSTAFQATPLMSIYSSSNVALLYFGEALYQELIGKGIKVKIICPSGMNSNFQSSAGVKKNANEILLDTRYVAKRILHSLLNNKIHLLLGKNTFITIIISRFIPKSYALKLWMILMTRLR